jgi:YbbR domain-containing protein
VTRFLRRNLGLKVFSLVLAYLTWAVVVGRSPGVRFITAPVEVEAPDGMLVADYQPREVRVRLEGDAPLLNRLLAQNVYARVRMDPAARAGTQRVTVLDRDLQGVPSGIAREVVTPLVTATLERKLLRTVNVRARFKGEPPKGYRISRALVEPATTEASGPDAALRQVEIVITEPIDVTTRTAPFTTAADLVRPDPLISLKPDIVRVTAMLEEIPVAVEFERPIVSNDPAFEPEPERVRIRLEGPPSLIERLRDRLTAVADAAAAAGRGNVAPVRLDMGDLNADEAARVRVVSVDPARVRLRRVDG